MKMNPSDSYCPICKTNFEETHSDPLHNNTDQHRFNFLLFEWNSYRKKLVQDRHGIVVEIHPEQSNIEVTYEKRKGRHSVKVTPEQFSTFGKQIRFRCFVKNKRNSAVFFRKALVLHPYSYFSLKDPNNNFENGKSVKLLPGSSYEVLVIFNSNDQIAISSYKIPVAFLFQTDLDDGAFTIARSIVISIQREVAEEEKQKSPFTNIEWPQQIKVIYPTQKSKYNDNYTIPKKYKNCILYGLNDIPSMTREEYIQLIELRKEIKQTGLNSENYQLFWHILLWLEEMGQIIMLERYNMENVTLKLLNGSLLELEVPGLAEKRPSVINNDMVDIKVHNDRRTCYRGTIKRVNDKTVEIAYLAQDILDVIKENPNTEMDVRFVLSRLNLERMHRGVDQVVLKRRVQDLFPSKESTLRTNRPSTINRFYNPLIANNGEQRTAVQNIVWNVSGSIPYIVFGPPGTGKTETIVEAILQLKDHKPDQKILVCAPANAACDLLANKLSEFSQREELIRVFSETVDINLIPPRVLEYSNYTQDGNFQKFSVKKLSQYKIVVTTLGLIGRYQGQYEPDIVFVDEAAQACEPEVNCALGVLKGLQIVLSGDPLQLGPFSSSRVAEQYGFGKSLLERLMELEAYDHHNENLITMLKLNFRSHPTVLKIPNDLFYEGKLKAVSETARNDCLAKIFINPIIQGTFNRYDMMNNRKQIVKDDAATEFCNVISEERREGRSPSYYNIQEAQTVCEYVKAMVHKLTDVGIVVAQEDIGVITPYIRQVHKIKELLKRSNFEKVEVGTTETFQGREKRVIIISTVRAREDLLLYDKKYNLGFVRHDKRFNVALTRAKTKLIVIGCAHVLATDTKWIKFIEQCTRLGTTCGATLSIRTSCVKDQIRKRFEQVNMRDVPPKKKWEQF